MKFNHKNCPYFLVCHFESVKILDCSATAFTQVNIASSETRKPPLLAYAFFPQSLSFSFWTVSIQNNCYALVTCASLYQRLIIFIQSGLQQMFWRVETLSRISFSFLLKLEKAVRAINAILLSVHGSYHNLRHGLTKRPAEANLFFKPKRNLYISTYGQRNISSLSIHRIKKWSIVLGQLFHLASKKSPE